MAGTLKVGDGLPSDVTFSYIPYTPEIDDITSCGIPVNYNASKGTFLLSPFVLFSPPTCPYYPSNLPFLPLQPRHIMTIPPFPTKTWLTFDVCLCRMGRQEGSRLLRSWRLHPQLLCQAPPRFHREAARAQEQWCRYRCLHCI
jgi:hypothetical protein